MLDRKSLLPLAALIFGAVVSAQTDFATIRGVALDPSGATVPSAKIDITNQSTGLSRETVTSSGGEYEIPYLPAGTYG